MIKLNCSTCNSSKDTTDFYKNVSYSRGFSYSCKDCLLKLKKDRRKTKIKKPRIRLTELQKEENKKQYRLKYRKRRAELQKIKLSSNCLFKLKRNLRNRVWALMKDSKSKSTQELLGCTFIEAKNHIEKSFTEGMTWQNYGEWHVDHIMPLASAETKEEVEKLFHYTNLQALWAADNTSKGSKII